MNSENPLDEGAVRRGIIENFASNTYPGDDRLMALDPEVDHDSGEIFERLQGVSWQGLLSHLESIDGPDLYWYCWVYSMLTPEAFFYYLPAFLIVSMDMHRVDTVADHLIYYLQSPETMDSDFRKQYVHEVINRLTPSQRTAIRNWARYLLDQYPEYWSLQELKHWL